MPIFQTKALNETQRNYKGVAAHTAGEEGGT